MSKIKRCSFCGSELTKLYKEEKIGISNNKYIVLISIFIGIFFIYGLLRNLK